MRILYVTPSYPSADKPNEGVFLEQQVEAIAATGVSIEVLVCKQWIPDRIAAHIKKYEHLVSFDAKLRTDAAPTESARYIHVPGYRFTSLTSSSLAHQVQSFLRRSSKAGRNFDVVHANDLWPAGIAVAAVSRRLDLPCILSAHTIDRDLNRADHRGQLARSALSKFSFIGCCGTPMLRDLRSLDSHSSTAMEVVPYGISPEVQIPYPTDFPIRRSRVRFVSIANLHPRKRIQNLLRSLARLRNDEANDWELIIIGGGGDTRKEELQRLAQNLAIADRCHFLGAQDHQRTMALLATADLFILPSIDEAFGLVYLEALHHGIPAVGCRGEGAEDLITDGVNGMLVAPDDEDDLTDRMQFFLSNTEICLEQWRPNALETAHRFSWRAHGERYRKAYEAANLNVC